MKTIKFSGVIGFPKNKDASDEEIKQFREDQIKEIVEYKEKVLNVDLGSLGGDVNHAIAVRNALAKNPAEILIEYTEWSASATTIIATAGKVRAAANIMILPHEARGGVQGVKSDIQSYANWLDKTNGIIAGMYAEKTGSEPGAMLELMAKNNGEGEWLTADEAKALGLIDEVFEPMKAAAFVDLTGTGLTAIPQEKLTILNQINMNIFKRKEEDKPINSVLLGEVIAVYEGELAAKTKLMPTNGEVLENGEYTLGDKILIVKDMEVEEVKTAEPKAVVAEEDEEMKKKDEAIENLTKIAETLTANFQAQTKEFETIKATLASIKSTHKTPVKTDITEVKTELPLNIQIKKEVQSEIAKLKKEDK